MPTLKKIKTITVGNNGFSLLQALSAYVFGGIPVREYDSNKTYKTGETIIRLNPSTGLIEILKCSFDGVTGPFDLTKWENINVNEVSGQQEAVVDDMLSLLSLLSPFVEKPLTLNTVHIDDLSDISTLNVLKGVYQPGKIFI